jgi:uncharacterized protein YbaP (TraB family)
VLERHLRGGGHAVARSFIRVACRQCARMAGGVDLMTFVSVLIGTLGALLSPSGFAQSRVDCPPVAQSPSQEQFEAGLRNGRDRGFLWRITKDGRSSYLYGTLHVATLEWMFPGPAVTQALRSSDTIALELDVLDPSVQRRMTLGMAAKPGAPPLPEALERRLQRFIESECVPRQTLEGLAPEAQIQVLQTLLGRRDGLDPAFGIDVFLAGWGRGANKPVVALETTEIQLKALRIGATPTEKIEFVEEGLAELENGNARTALRRAAGAWASSDLDTLSRYESWCNCVNTAADRLELKSLIDERNPAMANGIAALHASGKRVFAAVGSLHMIGPSGLPALLAERGYRVERIGAGS